MPRRECSIFACPALAGLLPPSLVPERPRRGGAASDHEWDNATRFLDFGTAEERACGLPPSRDGPALPARRARRPADPGAIRRWTPSTPAMQPARPIPGRDVRAILEGSEC